jgi:hypothetical protein
MSIKVITIAESDALIERAAARKHMTPVDYIADYGFKSLFVGKKIVADADKDRAQAAEDAHFDATGAWVSAIDSSSSDAIKEAYKVVQACEAAIANIKTASPGYAPGAVT